MWVLGGGAGAACGLKLSTSNGAKLMELSFRLRLALFAPSSLDPGQCLSGAFTEGGLCTAPSLVGLPHIPSPQHRGLWVYTHF